MKKIILLATVLACIQPLVAQVNRYLSSQTPISRDSLIGDSLHTWFLDENGGEIYHEARLASTVSAENSVTFFEKGPKALNFDEIKEVIGYPDSLEKAGINGAVVMRVQVLPNGSIGGIKAIKADYDVLLKLVIPHIYELKFSPALQNGNPITLWVYISFSFGKNFSNTPLIALNLPLSNHSDTTIYRSKNILSISQPKSDSIHVTWFTESGQVMGQATVPNDFAASVLVDTPPVPVNMAHIQEEIRKHGNLTPSNIHGGVILRAYISTEGKVLYLIPILADHEEIINLIYPFMKNLICKPAIDNGKSYNFWINIPFSFGKKYTKPYPSLHPRQ